jgi:hypothetical protein
LRCWLTRRLNIRGCDASTFEELSPANRRRHRANVPAVMPSESATSRADSLPLSTNSTARRRSSSVIRPFTTPPRMSTARLGGIVRSASASGSSMSLSPISRASSAASEEPPWPRPHVESPLLPRFVHRAQVHGPRHTAAFRRCGRPDLPMSGWGAGLQRSSSHDGQQLETAGMPHGRALKRPG